jgi:cell wall-associated NlpC family hydrolase
MDATFSEPLRMNAMNELKTYIIVLLFAFFIAGCSSVPENTTTHQPVVSKTDTSSLSDPIVTKKQLYQQFKQWKGTPYSDGGLSKKGVDCSGFVYLTYLKKFGLSLSRTTRLQSKSGKEVRKADLRPGDLVFFKTGASQRHVGIYLEENKFVHASTKKGVMISRLNDYYWKDRYWLSRRMDD